MSDKRVSNIVLYLGATGAGVLLAVLFFLIKGNSSDAEEKQAAPPREAVRPAPSGSAANAGTDEVRKTARKDTREVLNLVKDYYSALAGDHFMAEQFFSQRIIQYINLKNTDPAGINAIYAGNTEYLQPVSRVIGDEVIFVREAAGVRYYNYWIDFSCYRSSLAKYQHCKVRVELGLDDEGKITVYRELQVKDLYYTESR